MSRYAAQGVNFRTAFVGHACHCFGHFPLERSSDDVAHETAISYIYRVSTSYSLEGCRRRFTSTIPAFLAKCTVISLRPCHGTGGIERKGSDARCSFPTGCQLSCLLFATGAGLYLHIGMNPRLPNNPISHIPPSNRSCFCGERATPPVHPTSSG